MEVSLDCAVEGPRAKVCDFITVLIPVAALGVFLFARTYLEFDKYAVSAFAYFYLPLCHKAWTCIVHWWTDWHWLRIAIHRMQESELYESTFYLCE